MGKLGLVARSVMGGMRRTCPPHCTSRLGARTGSRERPRSPRSPHASTCRAHIHSPPSLTHLHPFLHPCPFHPHFRLLHCCLCCLPVSIPALVPFPYSSHSPPLPHSCAQPNPQPISIAVPVPIPVLTAVLSLFTSLSPASLPPSCPIPSYLVPSYPTISFSIASHPIQSCPLPSRFILFHPIPSYCSCPHPLLILLPIPVLIHVLAPSLPQTSSSPPSPPCHPCPQHHLQCHQPQDRPDAWGDAEGALSPWWGAEPCHRPILLG